MGSQLFMYASEDEVNNSLSFVCIIIFLQSIFFVQIKKKVALGRFGEATDMAGAALFLASPAASWVTGAVIPVDGGALMLPGAL